MNFTAPYAQCTPNALTLLGADFRHIIIMFIHQNIPREMNENSLVRVEPAQMHCSAL